MPKFRVGAALEQGWYTVIEAETQEEAEHILLDKLNTDGELAIDDITHRDFWIIESEQL